MAGMRPSAIHAARVHTLRKVSREVVEWSRQLAHRVGTYRLGSAGADAQLSQEVQLVEVDVL